MRKYSLLLLMLMLMLAGCSNAPAGSRESAAAANTIKSQESSSKVSVPVFSGDSAYRFVAEQVAFGPRVPNSEGHKACSNYLEAKLRSYGAEVTVQTADLTAYNGDVLHARNIIASFQPEKSDRVLLFAHWDTRPWADSDSDPANHYKPIPGANDGGSGVGVLLEIARHLAAQPTEVGVDIILFDAEDYGRHEADQKDAKFWESTWALGSEYWAKNPHVKDYKARYGILLDIVGAPDSKFYCEGYSMQFAPNLVANVWNTAANLGYSEYFQLYTGGIITDDHVNVYNYRFIPCIDIINCDPESPNGFGPYHHTMKDDMDWIDSKSLKAVGQTVLEVIYNER